MRPATRLNDFCKRGVAAQPASGRRIANDARLWSRKASRTRASTLLPTDYGDAVMDVHMLPASVFEALGFPWHDTPGFSDGPYS